MADIKKVKVKAKATKAKPEASPKASNETSPKTSKEVDGIKLSKDSQKVLELVEKMTVLELADLVKTMEDKFGVSAAPVAVAGPAVAGETEEVEEKTSFTVVLKSGGEQKINVIKAIREVTELGLKEAKDLVESAPQNVKENIKKDEAEEIKKKIEEAGATVELV